MKGCVTRLLLGLDMGFEKDTHMWLIQLTEYNCTTPGNYKHKSKVINKFSKKCLVQVTVIGDRRIIQGSTFLWQAIPISNGKNISGSNWMMFKARKSSRVEGDADGR